MKSTINCKVFFCFSMFVIKFSIIIGQGYDKNKVEFPDNDFLRRTFGEKRIETREFLVESKTTIDNPDSIFIDTIYRYPNISFKYNVLQAEIREFRNGNISKIKKYQGKNRLVYYAQFLNGTSNGPCISFDYETGNPISLSVFQKDSSLIPSIHLFASGKIKSITYQISKISFLTREYYENGNLKLEQASFDSLHVWFVSMKFYYPNGRLREEYYINSDFVYPYHFYFENGEVKIMGKMQCSTRFRRGKWLEYFENGTVKTEAHYREQKDINDPEIKEGEWIYYDEKNKIEKKEYYENDKLIRTETK